MSQQKNIEQKENNPNTKYSASIAAASALLSLNMSKYKDAMAIASMKMHKKRITASCTPSLRDSETSFS
ncbi:MAG: hypothetical protein MZV70_50270 [Desulfobacterales bacterium]|nr:hypothetical protein [Desulfobacterales bacterium]